MQTKVFAALSAEITFAHLGFAMSLGHNAADCGAAASKAREIGCIDLLADLLHKPKMSMGQSINQQEVLEASVPESYYPK